MNPILIHYSLTLDLAGCTDMDGLVDQFLKQADFAELDTSTEMLGQKCTIRFTVNGPSTLDELRQMLRHLPRGIFAEVTRTAIKALKERPNDLYLNLAARLPLFELETRS